MELEPGTYRVQQNMAVNPTVMQDEILRLLEAGALVDVIEIRHVEKDCRIRGRLVQGGWISIRDTTDEHMFARPAEAKEMDFVPGLYKLRKERAVSESVEREGEILSLLEVDTVVEIVEIKHAEEDCCIRGKVKTGGWISIWDGHMLALHKLPKLPQINVNDVVRVLEECTSNCQDEEVTLYPGYLGEVLEIDEDGDALVDFKIAEIRDTAWIQLEDFSRLEVLPAGTPVPRQSTRSRADSGTTSNASTATSAVPRGPALARLGTPRNNSGGKDPPERADNGHFSCCCLSK